MHPSPPDTRASLILRLQDAADVVAWDEFTAIYAPPVFRLAKRYGLQQADADDLVQEVLAAAAKSVTQWLERENRSSFRAWLFRIARNKAMLVTGKHHSFAVTAGPATLVPDDLPPAIDRTLLELPGHAPVKAEYLDQGTPALSFYRVDSGSASDAADESVAISIGDRLSAILPSGPAELFLSENVARVTMLDDQAGLFLPALKAIRHYDHLVTIDKAIPE